jgi:hypothetical protein
MASIADRALVEMERRFESAAEDIGDLLGQATVQQATVDWATAHLIARSLADLKCAMYLVGRGFVVQMYSVMQPVRESMNLIRLFQSHPEKLDDWIAGKHWAFTPAKVRVELGIENDPIYAWMSEHSHPRFAASQVSMYSTGSTTGVIVAGGLPRDHPEVLLAAALPGDPLTEVAMAAGEVPLTHAEAARWPATVRRVIQTLIPGVEGLFDAIGETVEDIDVRLVADEVLATMNKRLAQAQAMEVAVADRPRGGGGS